VIILQSDLPLLTTTLGDVPPGPVPIMPDPIQDPISHQESHTQDPSRHSSSATPSPEITIASWLSCGRSCDRCATMRHLGHPLAGTSPAHLGLEGSNPHLLTLSVIFLLLMPLPLYRTVGLGLILFSIAALYMQPVPYSHRDLFPSMRTAALVPLLSGPVS